MDHKGTKTIVSDKLVLRRFAASDAQAMFENWASDPVVTKFLTWPTHKCIETTNKVISEWVKQYDKEDFYVWGIAKKEKSGVLIGSISVVDINNSINSVQIGYSLGKMWWNQGIMTEALSSVICYMFTMVQVNRIEARHDPRNPASGRVMRKCGMKYEGTYREADRNNQGVCDASVYAILAKEFQK